MRLLSKPVLFKRAAASCRHVSNKTPDCAIIVTMNIQLCSIIWLLRHHKAWHKYFIMYTNRGKNQALVGVIPFCGEYPGPRFEDKFRSANQKDGISIAGEGKMADI